MSENDSGSTSSLQVNDPDSSYYKGGDAFSGGTIGRKNFNYGANPNISALSNSNGVVFLLAGVVAYFLVKKGVFK